MGIELLREYDLEGITQNCVKWNCSCGAARVIPFEKVKNREKTSCPQCGCFSSFHSGVIEKLEKELNSEPSDH
jgi:hypothetical protein